jgi:alpha-glucosidase
MYMFKWANWFKKEELQKEVLSPNGRVKCLFELVNSQLYYSITKDNQRIIKRSKLGIEICGEEPFNNSLSSVRVQNKKHEETIEMPWGEERYIDNNYNEMSVFLAESKAPNRIFTVRFRVFDSGVAFRYELPPQPKFQQITVKNELTEFNLDLNSTVWKIPSYQPDRYEYNYERIPLYELKGSAHTPFTLRTPNGHFVSLHEAALYDYGSMNIALNNQRVAYSDITPLSDGTRAHVALPFQTPWRVIMIAGSAIELTTNRMIYCLNDAPSGDFSWVKTLKFIGIWWAMYVGEWTWAPGERHGATTEHAEEYIDAAVRLGIRGLLIEGWNDGWEGDWLENGINNKFTVPESDFDLPAVANYASSKGVEIVGHHETVGFIDNYEHQ